MNTICQNMLHFQWAIHQKLYICHIGNGTVIYREWTTTGDRRRRVDENPKPKRKKTKTKKEGKKTEERAQIDMDISDNREEAEQRRR